MRINNQILIEWAIEGSYEDHSFEKAIDNAFEQLSLNDGETVKIHQVVKVGEFNTKTIYLIILNVTSGKG